MSTHTATLPGHGLSSTPTSKKTGFWARFFTGLVASREREARLRVSHHLRGMPDRQLRDIGFSEHEIFALRTTGSLPGPTQD